MKTYNRMRPLSPARRSPRASSSRCRTCTPRPCRRGSAGEGAGACERPYARADHGRRQPAWNRGERHHPDRREAWPTSARTWCSPRCATRSCPDGGRAPERRAVVTVLTAEWQDSTDRMRSTLPSVVVFVSAAFGPDLSRSARIVVAAKAILLNLLSVAAARRDGARLRARCRQGMAGLNSPRSSTRSCRSCPS